MIGDNLITDEKINPEGNQNVPEIEATAKAQISEN